MANKQRKHFRNTLLEIPTGGKAQAMKDITGDFDTVLNRVIPNYLPYEKDLLEFLKTT